MTAIPSPQSRAQWSTTATVATTLPAGRDFDGPSARTPYV